MLRFKGVLMIFNLNKLIFYMDRSCLFKDWFVEWGIFVGGVMVFIVLLLIFFYFLYVV